jgi:DNA polymerase-1
MAPEAVCISFVAPGERPGILHANDPRTLPLITSWLEGRDILSGHHFPYDLAVFCAKWAHLVPLVFAKFDRDEITDTLIRSQLLDIAAGQFRGYLKKFQKEVTQEEEVCRFHGFECNSLVACGEVGHVALQNVTRVVNAARWIPHNYNLDDLNYRATGRRLDKNTWRMRYGEFIDVPVEQWPEGARQYPLDDAVACLDVFLKQEEHVQYIPDQFRQARAAWALHLTHLWGLRTHGPGVELLERETVESLAQIEGGLREAGLVRTEISKRTGKPTKKDGSRNVDAARKLMVQVCQAKGKPVRLTDTGQVSLDSDACDASENELLEEYAELTSLKSVLNKDLPMLRAGMVYPVHTTFGMAASCRSTSSKPNVQNPRRLPGIREAFIPRKGKVYAIADFSGLELHTLAQTCVTLFGQSQLAVELNAGIDPHTSFAAKILGISYEEGKRRKKDSEDKEFDNSRQTAKVFNFGSPGGLGAENLCMFARKTYNVILTEPITPSEPDPFRRAKALKQQWMDHYPEMRIFFKYVGELMEQSEDGQGVVQQLFSNRWRGGCHYTAACNTYFQGLGADAAKRALYLVTRACYSESSNVLYGSRPVNFVHDEVILEVDDDYYAHDKAIELGRLMIQGANEFLPDVPARAEPLLARCWSKLAKPTYDANKRLIPWEPKRVEVRLVKELGQGATT